MKITPAERTALEAVRQFGTVKAAAAALGKSPRTLEQQLAAVREKAGVRRTIQVPE